MQGPDLSQPERFVMADTVTKNSKTGITANKRLLVIKKGYLFYYSKVPKNFTNDKKFLENQSELPKCSIQILNIKKINGFQQNSNYFSIQFEARHMMEREDIRKTMTLQQFNFAPKNKKSAITWQFTCDNQFIKQKWVHTLQTLHSFYSKQKINIQKFFDNINKKEEDPTSKPAIRSSLMVPWREDQVKKSSSNESLTKVRASQMAMNRSKNPNKQKNSANSNNSQKNEPKQFNQNSLFSHQNQEEDLVETFMKIEKTQSAHESPIRQKSKDVSQLHEVVNMEQNAGLDADKKQQFETPEANKQDENVKSVSSFTKKMSPQAQTLQKIEQKQKTSENTKQNLAQQQSKVMQKVGKEQKEIKLDNIFEHSIPKLEILFSDSGVQQFGSPKQVGRKISLLSEKKQQKIQYGINRNTNFYQIVFFSCNRQYSFEKRIEAQKKLNSLVGNFNQRATKNFIQFVSEKSGNKSGRFYEDKIGESLASVEIGLQRYKIGYVNTQSVTINGKQKIFYNQSTVKSIKKQMKIYNKLFSIISNNIKSSLDNQSPKSSLELSSSLSLSRSIALTEIYQLASQGKQSALPLPSHISIFLLKLRVPLCTYVEYKGISALAFDRSISEKEISILDKDKISQWKQIMRILGFNSECFQFKKIHSQIGDLIVVYIIDTHQIELKKQNKHHNVSFISPLNVQFLQSAKQEQASTSTQSLLEYIKSLEKISPQNLSCPKKQIQTALSYCYLCKYLRKFYRAAQAEIDELKFINLLLKGDENMDRLIESSGFEAIKLNSNTINGVFFEFLLFYLGISCAVDIHKLHKFGKLKKIGIQPDIQETQKCVISVKLIPRVIGYQLQCLQLYELVAKTEQYLSNNNKQLASTSLEYKQSCYFENAYQSASYPYPSALNCIINQAELNYLQNDYISCIGKCKQYLEISRLSDDSFDYDNSYSQHHSEGNAQKTLNQPERVLVGSNCIPAYLLLIKCYSKFSKDKFDSSVRDAMACAIDNFGEYSQVVVTLFQFIGLVYSGNGDYTQAEAYIRVGVTVGEKVYEGTSKGKLTELYLDLSRVLMHGGKVDQSNLYLSKAQKIIQGSGSATQKMNLLLFTLQSVLKSPSNPKIQLKCLQLIHELSSNFQSNIKNVSLSGLKQFYTLMHQAGIKFENKQFVIKSICELWKLDISCKTTAIQFGYRLVGSQYQGMNRGRWRQIGKKWDISREKSVLVIEKGLLSYKNMVEMLEQVLMEEEDELVAAILKLLPPEIFKSF